MAFHSSINLKQHSRSNQRDLHTPGLGEVVFRYHLHSSGSRLCLTAVMDWAGRYVLSREVSVTMDDVFLR